MTTTLKSLRNMAPSDVSNDATDSRLGDAVRLSERSLGSSAPNSFSDLYNFSFSQFVQGLKFAFAATLSSHILKVFLASPKKEVSRIATETVVTPMAHVHSRRCLTNFQDEGNPMSGLHGGPEVLTTKSAISARADSSLPFPAIGIGTDGNSIPEAFREAVNVPAGFISCCSVTPVSKVVGMAEAMPVVGIRAQIASSHGAILS